MKIKYPSKPIKGSDVDTAGETDATPSTSAKKASNAAGEFEKGVSTTQIPSTDYDMSGIKGKDPFKNGPLAATLKPWVEAKPRPGDQMRAFFTKARPGVVNVKTGAEVMTRPSKYKDYSQVNDDYVDKYTVVTYGGITLKSVDPLLKPEKKSTIDQTSGTLEITANARGSRYILDIPGFIEKNETPHGWTKGPGQSAPGTDHHSEAINVVPDDGEVFTRRIGNVSESFSEVMYGDDIILRAVKSDDGHAYTELIDVERLTRVTIDQVGRFESYDLSKDSLQRNQDPGRGAVGDIGFP